ncbi:MAG TPA: hypothetical protein ENN56_02590 [Firmicutes bacterium]|nr:hypothetical protein [Bacillota bacterium]
MRGARVAFQRVFDAIFLARPVLLGPVWVVYGAGAVIAGARPGIDLLFVSLVVAGVYIHNQIADVDADRANDKLFLLADGLVSRRTAWTLAVTYWIAALAWAALHGQRFWLYLTAFLLGFAYNAGVPSPWKGRPWLGLLANAAAHATITFMAGYVAAGGDFAEGFVRSMPYTTAVAAVYLGTTIMDHVGDAAVGKQTFAVRYGARTTSRVIGALIVASAVFAGALGDWWMATASVCAIVSLPWLLRNPSRVSAERVVKTAVLALSVVVAIRWPILGVLAAATFFASRIYYCRRFSIRYPSFGPTQTTL